MERASPENFGTKISAAHVDIKEETGKLKFWKIDKIMKAIKKKHTTQRYKVKEHDIFSSEIPTTKRDHERKKIFQKCVRNITSGV